MRDTDTDQRGVGGTGGGHGDHDPVRDALQHDDIIEQGVSVIATMQFGMTAAHWERSG